MKTQLLGFFTPWIIYAIITFLHYLLPGKWVEGYVKHETTGELLNGLRLLADIDETG